MLGANIGWFEWSVWGRPAAAIYPVVTDLWSTTGYGGQIVLPYSVETNLIAGKKLYFVYYCTMRPPGGG